MKDNRIPTILVFTREGKVQDMVPVYTNKSREEIQQAIVSIQRHESFNMVELCNQCPHQERVTSPECEDCEKQFLGIEKIVDKMKENKDIIGMDGPARIKVYNNLELEV
jgi:hypothetical protein